MITTVTYKRPHNYHKSTFKCATRGIAIRSFRDEAEARAFAKTVDTVHIYQNGKKIG
jgi:hypothetical protein